MARRCKTKPGAVEEWFCREMCPNLPVMSCRGVLEKNGVYACPVDKTQRRGPASVFTANLRTKQGPAKWGLADAVLTRAL
jgi:hypothetical protein